jgi:hypothetical protein
MSWLRKKMLLIKDRRAVASAIKSIEIHLEITQEIQKSADPKKVWVGANNAQVMQLNQALKLLKQREKVLHR